MKSRIRISSLFLLLFLGVFFLAGCAKNNSKVTIVGSSAMQLLAEQAGNDYRLSHTESNIVVQGGGSGTGLSQIQAGAVQIGTSDIFAENQAGIKANKLVDHLIAVVGIVPIVNKDIGVKNLSSNQLRDIFTGKITNWKQVGGKNEAITVINRSKGSGTRSSFESLILKGANPIKAQEQDSNGAVKKIVATTPGTISYLSFPYAIDPHIQKLSLNHVAPTNQNVQTNRWTLWSYEHMYTQKNPNKLTHSFIKYMLSNAVQEKLIPKIGYISIHAMKVKRNSQNQIIS